MTAGRPGTTLRFASTLSAGSKGSFIEPTPVTKFTDDEEMTRDAARQWAQNDLKPLVREMDNNGAIYPQIIEDLFQYGFMGMVRKSIANSFDPY